MTRRRKSPPVEVVRIDAADVAGLYMGKVDFPVIAYAGMERGKRLIGVGGLAWLDRRCWLWLDHCDMKHRHPLVVVRWAKRMLDKAAQLGEAEVWARREKGIEPLSAELLTLLGFVRVTDEDAIEDWKWQRSPQSQSASQSPAP